jgi:hypothetical protein
MLVHQHTAGAEAVAALVGVLGEWSMVKVAGDGSLKTLLWSMPAGCSNHDMIKPNTG